MLSLVGLEVEKMSAHNKEGKAGKEDEEADA